MTPLVEKYRPRTLDAFAGLAGPRAILGALAANPYPSAWLFLGPSGLGKTTMALALAEAIGGTVYHIASRQCDLATVDDVCHKCWYVPMTGRWNFVICDESDQMTRAAQLAFLSKLDTTAAPPNTIFMFTANETTLLEKRFLSRCRTVKFSNDAALLDPAIALLARIWAAEAPGRAEPDFQAMMCASEFNIRSAIMTLEMELLAGGSFVPFNPPIAVEKAAKPLAARSERRSIVHVSHGCGGDVVNAYELAALLKINVATIYNRVKRGMLPKPNRAGRSMTWRRAEIEA